MWHALLLQITTPEITEVATVVAEKPGLNIWTHILASDPLVKLTLLLLICASILSWAIIFFKWSQLKRAEGATTSFFDRFQAVLKLSEFSEAKTVRYGPVFQLFRVGQDILARLRKASARLTEAQKALLAQRLNQSREDEVVKLEQFLPFLATTASVAPFVGLLGTVWGILTAFMAIGQAGSSSLATVGPYIAEALVATAVGLFAAIPALVGYNFFVHKIKGITRTLDMFVEEFVIKSDLEGQA